jgi:hypothetical protein
LEDGLEAGMEERAAADTRLVVLVGSEEVGFGDADRPLMVIFGVEDLMFGVVDRPLTLFTGVGGWLKFSNEDITSANFPITPRTGGEEPGLCEEEDGVAVVGSPLILVGGAELDTTPDAAAPIVLGSPPPVT